MSADPTPSRPVNLPVRFASRDPGPLEVLPLSLSLRKVVALSLSLESRGRERERALYKTRVRYYRAGRSKFLAINWYILLNSIRPIIIAKPDHPRHRATTFFKSLQCACSSLSYLSLSLSREMIETDDRDLLCKGEQVMNASGICAYSNDILECRWVQQDGRR